MSSLDKEKIVNKQIQRKYDAKSRRQKEKRTERITLRSTSTVKEQFENICKKSGKSQSEVFEEFVLKNKVTIVPGAEEASKKLCNIYNELHKLQIIIQNKGITGAEEYIRQQRENVEKVSNDLFTNLKKGVF